MWSRYQRNLPPASLRVPRATATLAVAVESIISAGVSVAASGALSDMPVSNSVALSRPLDAVVRGSVVSPAIVLDLISQIDRDLGWTPAPLQLPRSVELDSCLARNYSDLPAGIQISTDPASPWFLNASSGQIALLDSRPFASATMFRHAADIVIDFRYDPTAVDREEFCRRILAAEAATTRPLIVFVRTESLYAFVADLDPFCFLREPIVIGTFCFYVIML